MTNSPNGPVTVPRSIIAEQVTAMLKYLDSLDPGLRGELFSDAIATLSVRDDVLVRLVPDIDVTSSPCSVAGAYLADNDPPILAVAESTSHRRRAFTVLHELGHHLQQSVFQLMDLPTGQPDGGIALEDAACDSFASALLLPKKLVDQHFTVEGPSAVSTVLLWESANASRAAVCVRSAQALKVPGHVTLLDEDGTVVFSSSRDLPPLRRGGNQANTPIFRAALRSATHSAQATTHFTYRDGIQGQELYAQSADIGGMTVIVSVTERAPWLKLSLPKYARGPLGRYRVCEHEACSHEFRTFEPPCSGCGVPKCPECRRCKCGFSSKEQTCTECYLVKVAHLFERGSEVCRDCS